MNIFILIFNYLTYFICGKENFKFNNKNYIINDKLNNTFINKEYKSNNNFMNYDIINSPNDNFMDYDIINNPKLLPIMYQCKCGKFVEEDLECCEKKIFIPISNKSIFLNC